MMSKTFSMRERILLIILAVLLITALYYLAVFIPTEETISKSQTEIAGLAGLMKIEDAKSARIKIMREALDQIADSDGVNTVTPVYDNFQNLLDELNTALLTADSYKLNFLEPRFEDGIAIRELQLIFYSTGYYSAKNILSELYSGKYRCDITAFKLTPAEKEANNLITAPVMASVSITYYELY